MAELTLVNVILTLGLIGTTGAFAFVSKKVGAIALWGLVATLMVVTLTFDFTIELTMGLSAISLLITVISVVIDA